MKAAVVSPSTRMAMFEDTPKDYLAGTVAEEASPVYSLIVRCGGIRKGRVLKIMPCVCILRQRAQRFRVNARHFFIDESFAEFFRLIQQNRSRHDVVPYCDAGFV
jgi:hypothetical protein